MRGDNERYAYKDKKTGEWISSAHEVNCGKDVLGRELKIGMYVIWQPYSSHDGMHIGKIVNRRSTRTEDKYTFVILTEEKKRIDRFGWELVSYLPEMLKDKFKEEK